MVFDTEVEVPDNTTAIPEYHTFQTPPEQAGYYAIMENGWKLVPGNKPEYVVFEPVNLKYVPEKITRFQAKAVLYSQGLLTTVEDLINNSTDPLLKLLWQDALYFERNSQALNTMAQQLGLSQEQLDDLFIAGEQISG